MKVEQINPFIEATTNVFTTMLKCAPRMGKVQLAASDGGDIVRTAVIGMSGTVRGAVAIAFPGRTAYNVVKRFLQTDEPIIDTDINDAIGEIANMIAGSAKAKLTGQQISIGLPTVVRGQKYSLTHPKDTVTLGVPFESDLGNFTLFVTFTKPANSEGGQAS
jgi:chemotaxis protein CheX